MFVKVFFQKALQLFSVSEKSINASSRCNLFLVETWDFPFLLDGRLFLDSVQVMLILDSVFGELLNFLRKSFFLERVIMDPNENWLYHAKPKPGTKILKIRNSTLHVFARKLCSSYLCNIIFFWREIQIPLEFLPLKISEKGQNKELHILTFYRQTFLLVL